MKFLVRMLVGTEEIFLIREIAAIDLLLTVHDFMKARQK